MVYRKCISLTPAQKKMADGILAGKDGFAEGVILPINAIFANRKMMSIEVCSHKDNEVNPHIRYALFEGSDEPFFVTMGADNLLGDHSVEYGDDTYVVSVVG